MTWASFHWGFFVRLGRAEPANAKSLAALARWWGAGSVYRPPALEGQIHSGPWGGTDARDRTGDLLIHNQAL